MQLSSAITGNADSGKHALHPLPLIRRHRLLNELDVQRLELMRIANRLVHGPGTVRIDSKHRVGVLAQLAHNGQIVRRSQLDLVDRPVGKLLHLGDHRLDLVDADRVVGEWDLRTVQAPQLIDRFALLLAPQIVGRLIQRALGERVLAQHPLSCCHSSAGSSSVMVARSSRTASSAAAIFRIV